MMHQRRAPYRMRAGASMETLIWLGVMVVTGVALWLAAPYHEKMVANRDLPQKDWWD